MTININTKIAAILKGHPDALETIVSLSPKFEKLRNPVLRKLMAGRASVAMACKMSGCSPEQFFKQLKPLGFDAEYSPAVAEEKKALPAFITTLKKEQIVELDVRQLIAVGEDPFKLIQEKVKLIQPGQVLKIINVFEPVPLIKLLERQGFLVYADIIHDNLVETYFYKTVHAAVDSPVKEDTSAGWEDLLVKYADRLQTVDVRQMEMPQPMHAILEALEILPLGKALFVYHKRIPVFLLPELAEKGFEYRIHEVADGEVHLLIYKD